MGWTGGLRRRCGVVGQWECPTVPLVTEKRVRAAVDRVSSHQFDNEGRRVMLGIRGLLADEHARMRVGQVAVPFGICTEPSNVKAGGQACPYKVNCPGCGHFPTDPSYPSQPKSYLQHVPAIL